MLRSAFRFASSARSIGHWLALGWLCAAPVLAGTPEQKLMALRDAAVRNDLPALMELALAPELGLALELTLGPDHLSFVLQLPK